MGKYFSLSVKRSFALRILAVAFVLVILPLVVRSFFVFKQQTSERVKDTFVAMHIEGRGSVTYLKNDIQKQKDFLDVIGSQIVWHDTALVNPNHFLKEMKTAYNVSSIFYIQAKEGKLICLFASDDNLVGKEFSSLREKLGEKEFTFLDWDPKQKKHYFYVGKEINEGMLIIGSSIQTWIDELTRQDLSPFPVDFSIIDENLFVLATSNTGLCSEKLHLKNIENIRNAYTFRCKGIDYLAIKFPIPFSKYFLALDAKQKSISILQQKDYVIDLLWLLLFIFGIGGVLTLFLVIRLSSPLSQLIKVIDEVGKGNSQVQYKNDKFGFEINIIGEHLNKMLHDLNTRQREVIAERTKAKVLENELEIGHQIQKNLLPSVLPMRGALDFGAAFIPALKVGGDFYDVIHREDGCYVFYVADISGKGVEACFFAFGLRNLLRSFSYNCKKANANGLKEIVDNVNFLFSQDAHATSLFATLWIGIVDPHEKVLYYLCLGHPPALIINNGALQRLSSDSIALGVKQISTKVQKISFSKDDCLLLYTDGVIEAENEEGKQFQINSLEKVFVENNKMLARDLSDKILQEVKSFRKDKEDDLALLVVKAL